MPVVRHFRVVVDRVQFAASRQLTKIKNSVKILLTGFFRLE